MEVPEVVRNKARACGALDWLDDLPGIVASLAIDWGLGVGEVLTGGTEALVLEVVLDDGTPAVLKLLVPRDGAARLEATVLRHTRGEGCALLLRDDPDRGALLVERLGPSLFDLGWPVDRRLEVLTDAARKVWRPAAGLGLTTGTEKAAWLAEHIARLWEALDRPCTARAVDHALACAARREARHDDERAVLCHGDVHQWNALSAGDGTFKLVDPDGLLAEPEYDLGILMREDSLDLVATGDPHRRSRWLARTCGLDEEAIWEWGVVERLSTGLVATEIELQPEAAQMLAVAEQVALSA